ncbi:hypothetical protein [Polyangium jinanense]|uniref:Lipoprotein n=1 Tax=Polyangium jinanense TaxID=2829994 RepID=A0A9X3XD86_9BACT|nr:hypothetical protein [Polyangium jinanense]MDC3960295.1 hypothetical protein [Polyangium jinanense]MDC3988494.1 hypothetical protein [Polyangium jinanense]
MKRTISTRWSGILGPLFLLLACAGPLGCEALIAAATSDGGAATEEGKAWLADFAKKYNATVEASKTDFASMEAYFNAIVQAQACSDATHGTFEDAWTVETVEGPMKVEDAERKCGQMRDAIRKKGSTEEACGYASLYVRAGEQRPGTEWTTTVMPLRNLGSMSAQRLDGARQIVPCDRMPAKGNKPAPIWKKEHVKGAEEICESGSIIVYDSTDWEIENASEGDEKYLVRHLDGVCWYPKAPVGGAFDVPPPCDDDGTPPNNETFSCLTKAGKLVLK